MTEVPGETFDKGLEVGRIAILSGVLVIGRTRDDGWDRDVAVVLVWFLLRSHDTALISIPELGGGRRLQAPVLVGTGHGHRLATPSRLRTHPQARFIALPRLLLLLLQSSRPATSTNDHGRLDLPRLAIVAIISRPGYRRSPNPTRSEHLGQSFLPLQLDLGRRGGLEIVLVLLDDQTGLTTLRYGDQGRIRRPSSLA